MDTIQIVRPAFRKPWTSGAKAYPEADTFEAAREGFKRVRKIQMFHMDNSGEAGAVACVSCGLRLDAAYPKNPDSADMKSPDMWSTWKFDPATRSVVGGMHYLCSWGNLLQRIIDLPRH